MAEPSSQMNMKRVFIWILILTLAMYIVYSRTSGTSTRPETDSPPAQQP
jgi:hypothetical protein